MRDIYEMDEPLESILQRPLTGFEKQQINAKPKALPHDGQTGGEESDDTPVMRHRLKEMALMQVANVDYPPREIRRSLIEIPPGARTA
ncbi:hypothetical protein [Chromobacterium paludis]|uniref:Uncharacterized protein n=1 Tax=Chromobacterium paludis TaxID=2605945 RepID=A0A5C1DHL5_9NEIS|nr:hypothetical protein [Chromobacterium paludis]QEL55118.1 hypothetical protein FYK34_05825 [Chromobacterium paludis]